jgi:spermidine synthase
MFKGHIVLEEVSPDLLMMFRIRNVLLNTRTKYQEVQIVDLHGFGRALILDNYIQSTELDEYIYHETLVHPPMTSHPNPMDILIIGGSEGATLREVLKHSCVERVVMVDIDGELIEYTRKYLETMHKGAFESEKLRLVIGDGYKYVMEAGPDQFDVVILDLTDPYSSEIAKKLYSVEFYMGIKNILRPYGVMVTQAGNSFFYADAYLEARENIREVFDNLLEYWAWIPSFGYNCNFIMASDYKESLSITPDEADKRLSKRGVETRLYNGDYHMSLLKQGIIVNREFL